MDRHLLLQHREMAQKHVAEAEQHVLKQRKLVARLISHGHDAAAAEALLAEFETSLRLHWEDLVRIQKEIGEAGAHKPD